jgi:hypothetical protein
MRLGLALGHAGDSFEEVPAVVERADRLGVDSVWSLEEHGTDGATVLAYLAGPDGAHQARRRHPADPGADSHEHCHDRDDPRLAHAA